MDIDFPGRKEALLKVIRFFKYTPMFYRTNLFLHERRVHAILKEILPIAEKVFPEFNSEKALALALVHDDAEILTGDVQLSDKLKMTEEEIASLDEKESAAIEGLSKRWGDDAFGFSYKELMYHALKKDCIEAEVVSYADKMDAYCEALHELFSGNKLFVSAVELYTKVIGDFTKKFPRIANIVPNPHAFLKIPEYGDFNAIAENGKLQNASSVEKETVMPHYNLWKKISVDNFGISVLIDVLEK